VDSVEPKSKEILLRLCQHFVEARILSTQEFCRQEIFVDARFLLLRTFLSAPIFWRRQCFVATNILSPPIFLLVFRIKDDYLLLMIVFCVYHNPLGFDRLFPVDHCFDHNKGCVQPHSYCFIPVLEFEECRATERMATGS
jgi:hypothetical protein